MSNEMQIGEAFVGDGVNAAHVNTVLGHRNGPVGTAWATSLASPRQGHVPFVAVLQPGLIAKPPTLFVNKAAPANDKHELLTWGAAQAGVAAGVADAVAEGVISQQQADECVLIAAVWVNPKADSEAEVFANNRRSAHDALANGANNYPPVADVVAARNAPANPFFSG